MRAAPDGHDTNPDWAAKAVRVAVALDVATDELAALIEDIRRRRIHETEGQRDARRKP